MSTDHRSQVCTALTRIGAQAPKVGVLDFGLGAGRIVQEMPRAEPDRSG